MRIGIVDYLLRCRDTRLFENAREAGVEGVELSVDRAGDSSRLLFDPDHAGDLLKSARSAGLVVTSVFATQFFAANLFDGNLERRSAHWRALRGIAERASWASAPIVVVPLLAASELAGELALMAFDQLLVQLGDWADAYQVRFAIKSSARSEHLIRLIGETRSDQIGVSFDPSLVAAIGRDPVVEWEAIHTRAIHIHLQDRTLDGVSRPLGEGDAPLRELARAIVARDYAGPLVLHTPAGEDAIESARRNTAAIHRLLIGARRVLAA